MPHIHPQQAAQTGGAPAHCHTMTASRVQCAALTLLCGPAGPARTPQHVEGTLACPSRLITLEMARGCQDHAHLIYAHICLGKKMGNSL